ncbi:MAG TPA: hypothetical protein PLE74_10905 [Candidatus Cloacimonadota bacterium]|nr:hypothetical protein [Candidatus Cloacimonadota bacterium]
MRALSMIVLLLMLFCSSMFAYDKTTQKTIHLSGITKIDGYYCKGWITMTNQGRLISFDSAAPIKMNIGVIPTGSRIVLFSNMKIQSVCLFKPTLLQGLPCIGQGPESPVMTFYPDGSLRTCYLTTNTWIQGILCHHGTFSRIILSPTGKLISCELAKTQKIGNQVVKARSVITLDESGRLLHVRKSNPVRSMFFDMMDKIL